MNESPDNPWDSYSPERREEIFARLQRAFIPQGAAPAPGVPVAEPAPPPPEVRERRLANRLAAHEPAHAWPVPPPDAWPDPPRPGTPPAYCAADLTRAQLVVLKGMPAYEQHLAALTDLEAARAPPLPLDDARARLADALHRAPDAQEQRHGYAWDVWAIGGGERFFAAYAWRPAGGGVEAAPYLLFFRCNCA